jgi:acyl-CoA thioesterase
MASVSKEQQQEAERVASVWNSPAPFKAATETHFVKVLGSGLSSSEDQDEDDTTLWRGTVANEFLTGVAVFGGCVVAIFVNAAKNEVARRGLQAKFPDVVSVSSTFLAPGKGGPLDITISTLRQGGRFLVLEYMVKQNQGGQFFKIVTGTITFSDMNGEEKAEGMTDMKQIPFPTLPPRDKCFKNSWAGHKGRPANTMWDLMTTLEPPFGERELEPAQLTRGWTKWARWTRDGDDARTPESLAFFSDLYGMPAMSKMGG